jgi:uncharacterized coiled-coil DUF342 family protein
MSRTATVDVQPIDRLEEKVRQLVAMIETLRGERTRALDDVARLQDEVDAAQARIAEGAAAIAEVAALREERDLIRARVAQMISQIDKISL